MTTVDESTRGPHDIGGLEGFGPVPRDEEDHQPWHVSVMRMLFAFIGLARAKGEVRYFVERLSPEQYRARSYYERWLVAVEALVDRARGAGEADRSEVASAPSAIARRLSDPSQPHAGGTAQREHPLFDVGSSVIVRGNPGPGHNRLPMYVRGRVGTVRAVYPKQERPTAQNENVGWETVYNVAFPASDLWPVGQAHDEVRIDLFESYLNQ